MRSGPFIQLRMRDMYVTNVKIIINIKNKISKNPIATSIVKKILNTVYEERKKYWQDKSNILMTVQY